jgi:hypothetical protein
MQKQPTEDSGADERGTASRGVAPPALPPRMAAPSHPLLDPALVAYFVAGGAAGAASRTVVSPLERLKIIQCALFLVWGWDVAEWVRADRCRGARRA